VNDSDVDGDTLTIQALGQAEHGSVALVNGMVLYTPSLNYHGGDSFTYTIADGQGGSALATVLVTIRSVNDDPVARDDEAATDEDTPTAIDVLFNDTDVDG